MSKVVTVHEGEKTKKIYEDGKVNHSCRENSVQFTYFRCKGKFLSLLRAVFFISVFVGEVCNLYLYCGVILPHPGRPALQNTAADANLRPVHPRGSVENADSRERGRQQE